MFMIELNGVKQGNETEKREGRGSPMEGSSFYGHGYVGFPTTQGTTFRDFS